MTTRSPHSSAELSRWRLVAQGLVGGQAESASSLVTRMGCTQGQDFPGSTTSLALRTQQRSLGAVHEAYDSGQIVRTWPMRGTLHVVAAADAAWMNALTAEPILRAMSRRRAELDLSDADVAAAGKIAAEATSDLPRTRAELLDAFAKEGIAHSPGAGYHTLVALAVSGVVVLGPLDDKLNSRGQRHEQLWANAASWLPKTEQMPRPTAIAEWATRYFLSHGPATWEDFRWWTKLGAREVNPIKEEVQAHLASAEVDGRTYWFDPELPQRVAQVGDAVNEPLLLPGFDEMILGYQDRTATLTKEHEQIVVPGKNGVFKGTLVVNAQAIATWKRPTKKGQPPLIEPFAAKLPAGLAGRLPTLPE